MLKIGYIGFGLMFVLYCFDFVVTLGTKRTAIMLVAKFLGIVFSARAYTLQKKTKWTFCEFVRKKRLIFVVRLVGEGVFWQLYAEKGSPFMVQNAWVDAIIFSLATVTGVTVFMIMLLLW